MPTFDFYCKKCHHNFESIVPFGKKSVPDCPKCQSKSVKKLLSPPTVIFKGAGFYKTDSRKQTETSKKTETPPPKVETKTEKTD